MTFEWGAVPIIVQLVYLEGILSIDNAAVLGALVSHLPHGDEIPWPRPLRLLARPAHRLLGGQRLAALKIGLLGAYLGRGSMLFLAAWVVRNRWLLFLGAAYLIYLALSHFGGHAEAGVARSRGPDAPAGLGFWAVVLNVELADLAFSLDNVVAAVALSREMWVILTGVFLGIVTMRFAAGVFVRLIQREPVLRAAAYLLVLVIGLQLMAEEFLGAHLTHGEKFLISAGTLGLSLLYAHTPPLQALGRRMAWLRLLLAAVMAGARWLLTPLVWSTRLLARGVGGLLRGQRPPVLVDSVTGPPPGRDGGA
ncbi:MAG: tellurium resistance protein TerC [Armatimonadota bacterium]|nr:tellurium resistance protein TerC [Armatimonadota bacterium]MDR7453199.1 tellurium resistance protein TerC [Armatimonadota bacterium]MDR7457916.1 tellurium resistance protein TerC [Armatimonadota bacterium]MDR7495526.1 tellurium resistance protein TerC [Armatimonadota bacterium]MDR7512758.1 tellurium resistance protein TerC [Armatimonadota bacterium]